MFNVVSGAVFASSVKSPPIAPESVLWFLYQGDGLVVIEDGDRFLPIAAVDLVDLALTPVRSQYLGCLQSGDSQTHCFSGEISDGDALPPGLTTVDLRRLFEAWDDVTAGLAGRAKQIVHWDRDHLYCGRCATPTEPMESERARRCPQCGLTSYPRLSPAIIIAVTRWDGDSEQILLARNHRFPPGRYSVVAGFVEPGETLEECAAREVGEEVGISIQNIRYFGSQPWPFPNSLMIGFTADYAGGEISLEESEIADAQWFAADQLPKLPPKISIARRLIDAYLARCGTSATKTSDW